MVPSDLGLRWQGGSRDTAFGRATPVRTDETVRAREGGVALRFPPQSKTPFAAPRSCHFQMAIRIIETNLKAGSPEMMPVPRAGGQFNCGGRGVKIFSVRPSALALPPATER